MDDSGAIFTQSYVPRLADVGEGGDLKRGGGGGTEARTVGSGEARKKITRYTDSPAHFHFVRAPFSTSRTFVKYGAVDFLRIASSLFMLRT